MPDLAETCECCGAAAGACAPGCYHHRSPVPPEGGAALLAAKMGTAPREAPRTVCVLHLRETTAEALDDHCSRTGLARVDVIEAAIAAYLRRG